MVKLMSSPKAATIKRLFAVSGNQCAFPRCPLPLVDEPSGKVTGRICHIKAQEPGGPRYDPNQTGDERHAYENLVLMCPIHHDVIDSDPESYTVERLLEIKANHEKGHSGGHELSDMLVNALITVSSNEITEGSMLLSQNQSGGQMAHQINNLLLNPDVSARLAQEIQLSRERQTILYRQALVQKWRQMIHDITLKLDEIERREAPRPAHVRSPEAFFLERHPDFSSLMSLLPQSAQYEIFGSITIHVGRTLPHALIYLIDEIGKIEEKWGLLDL